jgi:putative transposase
LYVDLNTVRAGAVPHPQDLAYGGYHEIQGNKRRNTIINLRSLMNDLEMDSIETLQTAHREWIDEALREGVSERNSLWPESVAVGSEAFALTSQAAFGVKDRNRDVTNGDDVYVLKETEASYGADFWVKNRPIALNNTYYWDGLAVKTAG